MNWVLPIEINGKQFKSDSELKQSNCPNGVWSKWLKPANEQIRPPNEAAAKTTFSCPSNYWIENEKKKTCSEISSSFEDGVVDLPMARTL